MPRTGKPTNDYLLPIMKASGLYHVDSRGRIWTKKKMGGPGAVYLHRWRRAETAPVGGGRSQVRHNGKMVYAHRFVWFWFNGRIPEDIDIDHKDNDKQNNHPRNLQALTHLENVRKAERDGLYRVSRYPSDNRKRAMKKWWSDPDVKEKMSDAAKRGWEKRRKRIQRSAV